MATWKCRHCGWENAGKWDSCAKCGKPKILDREQLRAFEEQQARLANFLLTTTPTLQGLVITQYLGIVTGVVVLGTGFYSELAGSIADILGTRSGAFQAKLEQARSAALKDLVEAAFAKGANAVVGLDLDYMEIGSNMLMVSANGTAVLAAATNGPS
jgi:uncharacterized protein YbjQ (UPF0145 family)